MPAGLYIGLKYIPFTFTVHLSDSRFYQHSLFGPFDRYNWVWMYIGFELQTELFLTVRTILGRWKLGPMFVYSILES